MSKFRTPWLLLGVIVLLVGTFVSGTTILPIPWQEAPKLLILLAGFALLSAVFIFLGVLRLTEGDSRDVD